MSYGEQHNLEQEIREAGQAARSTERPLVMAGVLLGLYSRCQLPIERTALAYVISQLLESTARPGTPEQE